MLRIEMNTRTIDDWNEIDFVELVGGSELADGILPVGTAGVWYVPDRGFIGRDSFQLVAFDCPFDLERASRAVEVPIFVSGIFPPPSPPPRVKVPQVRLGILLPMFAHASASFSPLAWTARVGVYQAVRELNNKSDGIFDNLLPNTRIDIAYRDSACDSATALQALLPLPRHAPTP